MMDLKVEFEDLLNRIKNLDISVLLVIVIFVQIIIQVAQIFFTVWLVVFAQGRMLADEQTIKLLKNKEVPWKLL